MDENKYTKKITLLRIICLILLVFFVIIWTHNFNFFFKDDYYWKKRKIKLEVQHLDVYENDIDKYILDKGEYSEVSLANKYQHFMRDFSYDNVNTNAFLKENYSKPRVINTISQCNEIIKICRDNGMDWDPTDDYNEKFFEKSSLISYYYEGENTYITDVFSLAEKIGDNKIRVKQTSLEGKLNKTYKRNNAIIVFIEIAKIPDEVKIEFSMNKIKAKINKDGYVSYYQLND